MAWDDPSPSNRGRAALSRSTTSASASPGYGDPGVSFSTLLLMTAVALFVGAMAYVAAHAGLVAWHRGQAAAHATSDKGIALVVGLIVAAVALRQFTRGPASRRFGDGFSWFGGRRRRGWDDDYDRRYPTLGEQAVADVVEGVVEGVIRAID